MFKYLMWKCHNSVKSNFFSRFSSISTQRLKGTYWRRWNRFVGFFFFVNENLKICVWNQHCIVVSTIVCLSYHINVNNNIIYHREIWQQKIIDLPFNAPFYLQWKTGKMPSSRLLKDLCDYSKRHPLNKGRLSGAYKHFFSTQKL